MDSQRFDVHKAIKKLQEKGINKYTCPICQGRKFSIPDTIATIHSSENVNSVVLGTYFPAVAVVCNNCGNMTFFSLGALGMMEEGEGNNAKQD